MKSIIFVLLAMFCHLGLFCQSKECKYDKNEVDKFTGKKMVWTKWEHLSQLISRDYAPDVRCVVEDSTKRLLLYFNGLSQTYDKPTRAGLDTFLVVPSGSKAIFLMEDGKPFELATGKEIRSSANFKPPYSKNNSSDKYVIDWDLFLVYDLDEKAIKTLTSNGVTTIRVYYKPENHRDYLVAKKKYSTIQDLIACIR